MSDSFFVEFFFFRLKLFYYNKLKLISVYKYKFLYISIITSTVLIMASRKTRSSTAKASTEKPVESPKTTKVSKSTKSTKPNKTSKTSKNVVEDSKPEAPKSTNSNVINDEEVVQAINIKDKAIENAVSALSKWNKKQQETSAKKNLFDEDDEEIPVYLQITANKYLSKSNVLKPRMITVPHPIHDLDDARVCIFVKDDLLDEESAARIEILKENELKNLAQIITVKDLKTKYNAYEKRRQLLSEYDIFLTDSSIANMIPKLLGKIFFESSKLPLTISVTENKKLSVDKFVKNFQKALNSIGFILPMGINMGFRLGMLGQDINNMKENIHAIARFLERFNIRLIQLKLTDSPSLPIYINKKIFTEDDVLKTDDTQNDGNRLNDIPLSIYAEGLKELGLDEEEANQIFGRKRKSDQLKDDSKTTTTKKSKN